MACVDIPLLWATVVTSDYRRNLSQDHNTPRELSAREVLLWDLGGTQRGVVAFLELSKRASAVKD